MHPFSLVLSGAPMKTATDRAVEAIEAAEKMFAEEMGATLELSPATKMALIATIADCDPSRRRRREAEARMGAVILALRWTGPPSSPRRLARAPADAEARRPNPQRLSLQLGAYGL